MTLKLSDEALYVSEMITNALQHARATPWRQLDQELDAWNSTATFWWRDDDAVTDGPKLQSLLRLAADTPLALAVIPARLEERLTAALAQTDVTVLQHGFAHINHAPRGQGLGACELCLHRAEAAVLADLVNGRDVLQGAFDSFLPVIAPPWNRIDPALYPALAGLGYCGATAFGPRDTAAPAPGLHLNHAHCDPVNWKRGGIFAGEAKALGQVIGHLSARRRGEADPDEATGLLTHHAGMDDDTWVFVRRLLAALAAHPKVRILTAQELFR